MERGASCKYQELLYQIGGHSMQTHPNLHSLPSHKLTILLEHLRLGEKHLKQHLNPRQFAELLNLTELDPIQTDAIKTDEIEKKGNITKAVDGLLTTLIGSWLGYIGFIKSRLESREGFIAIICLATAIGLYVGYYNYRLIKSREQEAKISQKLHNLQHNILKIILNKKEKALSNLIFFITSALKKTNSDNTSLFSNKEAFDTLEATTQWLIPLLQNLKSKHESIPTHTPLYNLCKTELQTTLEGLEKFLKKKQTTNT